MRSKFLLAGALTLALAAPAAAQNNTGNPGWTVNIFNVGTATWSGFQAVYEPGGQPGVWQPNNAQTQWISAWDDFSAADGVGDYNHTNDANNRYRYLFRYDVGGVANAGIAGFTMGWDNILKGFQFSNGSQLTPVSTYNLSSTDRSVDDHFGFCRDVDAIWDSGNGVCTAEFAVPHAAGATWMEFELWGDGQTDGMWLAWDVQSTPFDVGVVPEPATMTLLATGLAGMAAAKRRRRKS